MLSDALLQNSTQAARLGVRAVLPSEHPLSSEQAIALTEIAGEAFIGVSDKAVPGRTQWISDICKKSGFSPRFVAETSNVTETFALISAEGSITLLPDYLDGKPPPGVTFVDIKDPHAKWSLTVLRQRGRGSPAVKFLVDTIGKNVRD